MAVTLLAPGLARAGTPDAMEILKKMQQVVNGFEDTEMEIDLSITDARGKSKTYGFNVKQRGAQRLMVFKSGEAKGQAVLVESLTSMYIYLPPPMNKVQQVAMGNMRQSFLGSDWNNTDISVVDWSEQYHVALDHEDEGFWYLKLTPKDPARSDYAWLVHKIGKEDPRLWGTEYFNSKGEHVKSFWVEDIRAFDGGQVWPHRVGMKDPRTGHKSIMDIKAFRVNQGFKADMFTPRYLKWLK
ncbi:MAG: outer membrane lipoprotein-sorting protein [Deltaproteobacteria bacterium]|nr:outer membrane lipoprotein-sorting protein [Deltaproteobacteria bacterium]